MYGLFIKYRIPSEFGGYEWTEDGNPIVTFDLKDDAEAYLEWIRNELLYIKHRFIIHQYIRPKHNLKPGEKYYEKL